MGNTLSQAKQRPKYKLAFPLVLHEYPWAYGWVNGVLINKQSTLPVQNLCVGLAKVWCNENNNNCVFIFDDAWSPRVRTDEQGRFSVYTWVEYATTGQPPYAGGTGDFVPIVLSTCSITNGYYDIIENPDDPNKVLVVRVYPELVTDVGTISTWLNGNIRQSEQGINRLVIPLETGE